MRIYRPNLTEKLFGELAHGFFHVTHGVVDVALGLVELTFGLKLLITGDLTAVSLDAALCFIGGALHMFAVDCLSPCTCQCMAQLNVPN
jgi:hypothetical protein